jgi:molybdopterin converting factor subunit 1
MQIHMRYFAALREMTGLREEALNIPENSTVAQVRAFLLTRYPQLENALARAVCAVNHQYVTPETPVQENDEIVFIPPVGGGERAEF